ncbi:MAG: phosphoadenylyl-sulfate reductase [Actinomycetota bacterium]|nr:MAG: phosphoadenylyl-sulfate reductase [Actinomycetota bacterium]
MPTDLLRGLAETGSRAVRATALENGDDPVVVATAALQWARRVLGERLVVASSMGDEVLVHLASEAVPGVDVVFLDTGYHFAETLGTRDAYAATRPLNLLTISPLRTVAEQDAEHGKDLWARNPDLCCALRKVEPLERALAPYDGWVTGMRREDAPTRADIDVISWDAKRGMIKVNPLAGWTQQDVDAYAEANGVLLNPLRELGYASIGCAPCTRAVAPGEDPRAGRWAGKGKVECGLHV